MLAAVVFPRRGCCQKIFWRNKYSFYGMLLALRGIELDDLCEGSQALFYQRYLVIETNRRLFIDILRKQGSKDVHGVVLSGRMMRRKIVLSRAARMIAKRQSAIEGLGTRYTTHREQFGARGDTFSLAMPRSTFRARDSRVYSSTTDSHFRSLPLTVLSNRKSPATHGSLVGWKMVAEVPLTGLFCAAHASPGGHARTRKPTCLSRSRLQFTACSRVNSATI